MMKILTKILFTVILLGTNLIHAAAATSITHDKGKQQQMSKLLEEVHALFLNNMEKLYQEIKETNDPIVKGKLNEIATNRWSNLSWYINTLVPQDQLQYAAQHGNTYKVIKILKENTKFLSDSKILGGILFYAIYGYSADIVEILLILGATPKLAFAGSSRGLATSREIGALLQKNDPRVKEAQSLGGAALYVYSDSNEKKL